MTKRLTSTTFAVLLPLGITACGGGGSTSPTPLPPSDAAPKQAAVTFNVDPSPIVATHSGNAWHHHAGTELYGFTVNLAFSEAAGVGYTVDTVHARLSGAAFGRNPHRTVRMHVPANERRVLQYASHLYLVAPGDKVGLTCEFTAAITDDRGNPISVSARVGVTHR